VLFAKQWSRRTIILLVMQTLDNAIALRPTQRPVRDLLAADRTGPERPNPTFIPVANEAAEWFAKRTGGIAQSSFTEAMFNIPSTAHILGGAVIAPDPARASWTPTSASSATRTCSSATARPIPANVGVNPSLTITALAEHAMSKVPAAGMGAAGGGRAERGRCGVAAELSDRSR
jgi:cholesterol oxidase